MGFYYCSVVRIDEAASDLWVGFTSLDVQEYDHWAASHVNGAARYIPPIHKVTFNTMY